MKSILATAALVLCTLQAYAGPEDHISAQTCYSLKSAAPAAVPSRVCLEQISITDVYSTSATLNIYSYFNQNLFNGMQLTYLARRNENGYTFRAANVLVDTYESGCGSAEKATLQISGPIDNDGLGYAEYVDVSVKYETLADTCHSHLQVQNFNYIKE